MVGTNHLHDLTLRLEHIFFLNSYKLSALFSFKARNSVLRVRGCEGNMSQLQFLSSSFIFVFSAVNVIKLKFKWNNKKVKYRVILSYVYPTKNTKGHVSMGFQYFFLHIIIEILG